MIKYVIALVAALTLTACAATHEDQNASMENAQRSLPADCTLAYIGKVAIAGSGYPANIFAVRCGDTVTTSVNTNVKSGKQTRSQTDVIITQN
jgi:hypothetical protein